MASPIHYVTFRSCTKAEYEASAKDEWSVYFITDTQEIYKGTQNYGSSAEGPSYTAGTGISILNNAIAISGASSATNGYILSKTAGGVAWISAPTGTVSSYAKQTTAITNLSVQPGVFYEWTVLAASQLSATNWSNTSYQESMLKIIKDASTITLNGIDFVKDETLTFTNAGTYYCKLYSWGGFLRLEIKEYRTGEESSSSEEESSSSSEEVSSSSEEESSSSEETATLTYRSYDVAGSTITLFANNVDLVDYQYNTDGLDARPVPDGFKAVSGIGDKSYLTGENTVGSFSGLSISDDGQLFMKDPFASGWIFLDSDTTWTAVSGFACSSVWYLQTYAYAINAGCLYSVKYDLFSSGISVDRIGTDSDWTAISGYSSQVLNHESNQWFAFGFGIRAGKLYKLSASTATQVGISAGWTAVSGVAYLEIIGTDEPTYYKAFAYGICDGRLYRFSANPDTVDVEEVGLSSDWTFISGYGFSCEVSSYWESSYDLYTYGICGGQLHRVLYDSENIGGDKTDWYRVWMVEPNEAVAIDGTPVEESSSSEEESSSSGEDLSDFTFNSFELLGTTLTDFATGVDIADYQYNEDGLDLQVLPDGYKAISGASAGMSFPIDNYPNHIGIDDNGMLKMEYPAAEFSWVIDSDTTWAKVSGICAATFEEAYAYATKTDGTLWAINFYEGSPVIQQVGVATGWTAISGYSDDSRPVSAFGICDGALYHLIGTTATRIGISSSWTAVTGFSRSDSGLHTCIGFGIDAGNLYTLASASPSADPTASLLDSGGVWTKVSGFGQVATSNGHYMGDFIWSTAYGIRDGSLMGIVGGYSYSEYETAYTVEAIDSTRTYHDVWLLSAGRTSYESTGIAVSKVPVE